MFDQCKPALLLLAAMTALQLSAAAQQQQPAEGPSDSKARKTWESAVDWERHRDKVIAMGEYRKANKQDGGHCLTCLNRAYRIANELGEFKEAVEIAREMAPAAGSDANKNVAHFLLARALEDRALADRETSCLAESDREYQTVIESDPRLTVARYHHAIILAYLHQDDAARQELQKFLSSDTKNPSLRERSKRLLARIELARVRMAPPFQATTIDGRQVSLDSLAGKVVLIDFWATWCGPCRAALPHIQAISRKFEGRPLVILSISLDKDETKWRDFVAKNQMTWTQIRAAGFDSLLPRRFNVNAIPATFSIDADGILEDQHVGDAGVEGKLKKMLEQAEKLAQEKAAAASGGL